MSAVTRAEIEALVKRHEKSLARAEAKSAALQKSLKRATTKNKLLSQSLKDALEQQTVISEILQIISNSRADTQPVFDAIVKSGANLFGGMNLSLRLIRGDFLESVASTLPLGDNSNPTAIGDMSMPSVRAMRLR